MKKDNSTNNQYSFSKPTEIQEFCLNQLKIKPLPSKQDEEWKSTDKRKLQDFLDYEYNPKFHQPQIPKGLNSQDVVRLFIGKEEKIDIKENEWEVTELDKNTINSLIKENLTEPIDGDSWSNLFNHSLSSKNNILGINITGKNIPPLELISNSQDEYLNAKTIVIFIDKETTVDITQINLGSKNSSLSISSYLFIGKSSLVNHGVISIGKEKSNLINTLNVLQKSGSSYSLGSLHYEFDFARFEIKINQTQGAAKTIIKGMQITKNSQQISTNTKIEFNGPEGYLDQLNKSIANDKSHSIFEGIIIVPQIAQRTDAAQLSRNILLSKHAKIDTKPQLEIIADDVKCKHGATISQLNEDELFYMRSRGLALEEASKLQLKSYYQEIISFIPISKERWDLLDFLLNTN